ncbi:hypothetical protein QUF80_07490 [Desulfococcaceae bacterium HSG8]|nr:hypothetical protein [Desulfococcaceae bacterium HSG8]
MEIALHLRNPDNKGDLPKVSNHLMDFYDQAFVGKEDLEKKSHSFNRVYVGDEFCSNRIPSLAEMKHFFSFAEEKNLNITLLTPVLTDEGIAKCSPLFEYLEKKHPETEVVVNDLGVLFYLKRNYPLFRLSAGRLFNKGFKDPRLSSNEKSSSISQEADELLNYSTFDHPDFQEKMAELSVTRLERDLLPYGNDVGEITGSDFKTSVYFPFGYVTSGRVCWTASFKQKIGERFVIPVKCPRPCNGMTLELKHKNFSFPLIQNGNTIFYLYTSSMLSYLLKRADHENLRLVYQGFIFGKEC